MSIVSLFNDLNPPRFKQDVVVKDGSQEVPKQVSSLVTIPPSSKAAVSRFQPPAFGDFLSQHKPDPESWSVADGVNCSLLQCPECPRKLHLQTLNNHLVGITTAFCGKVQ